MRPSPSTSSSGSAGAPGHQAPASRRRRLRGGPDRGPRRPPGPPPGDRPRGRLRRMLPGLAVMLVSSMLSLLLAEWVFSRVSPQPTYAVKYAPWGFEHIPNISFKHTPESRESLSTVSYNSRGFRGRREFDEDKPPGTLRVALLGDSYGEGAEVDEPYLHTTRLQKLLEEALGGAGRDGAAGARDAAASTYDRAEVINAGVYAYDTCQELRLFEARVAPFRPDVVFVIYTGESDENATWCAMSEGELVYHDLRPSRISSAIRYAGGWIKAKSHLANYVHRLYRQARGVEPAVPDRLARPLTYTPPDSAEFTAPGERATRAGDYLSVLDGRAALEGNVALTAEIMRRLDRRVAAAGGRLVVVFSHAAPSTYAWTTGEQAAGLLALDLAAYIVDARTRPSHFPIDGHWNEYGHELTARALFGVTAAVVPMRGGTEPGSARRQDPAGTVPPG